MMKRIVLAMLIVFFITINFFPVNASAKEKVLKLATWLTAKHFVSVQQTAWVDQVNAELAGKLKIVEYPGGQLYGPKDMHMAVAKNSITIGQVLQPALMATVPMLQGVYLPFAFENLDQVVKAYSGESLKIIERALEKKRMKLIYVSFLDGGHIFSSKKNLETVDAFKGFRILTSSPIISEIFAKLGAAPDPSIPQTEQYMALKRGVSDAVTQTTVAGFFQKTYEVAPYITQMDMSFPTILTCMNLKAWNKLSKEDQDTMLRLGKKASEATIVAVRGWEAKYTEKMAGLGATIIQMPQEERAQIKKVSQSVYENWAKENGPDARRLLEINCDL